MCGLRTRPRTDVDPPRFLPPSNCHRRGAYRLAAVGAIPCCFPNCVVLSARITGVRCKSSLVLDVLLELVEKMTNSGVQGKEDLDLYLRYS